MSRFAGGTAVCGGNKQRLRMRVQAEKLLPLPATVRVFQNHELGLGVPGLGVAKCRGAAQMAPPVLGRPAEL